MPFSTLFQDISSNDGIPVDGRLSNDFCLHGSLTRSVHIKNIIEFSQTRVTSLCTVIELVMAVVIRLIFC